MSEHDGEHHIEVRSGIGEPPSMQLRAGREVGPLSLGRSGSWKLSALGVLDLHGYIYFNGAELFLQSTDAASPVLFRGAPVPLGRWTSVRGPGEIIVGSAVLLLSGGGAADAPSLGMSQSQQVRAAVPPSRPSAPERPFAPGAFSNIRDEDSDATRLQPIEELAAARLGRPVPRPAAGAPVPGMPPSLEGRAPMGSAGTMVMPQFEPMPGGGYAPEPLSPHAGHPAMAQPGPGGMHPGMHGMPPQGMAGPMNSYPQGPMGAPGGAPYAYSGSMPMGTAPEMIYPTGAGAPGAQPGKPSPTDQLKAQWAKATPIQKAILALMPFAMIGSWFAFGEEEAPQPPPRRPASSASASASASGPPGEPTGEPMTDHADAAPSGTAIASVEPSATPGPSTAAPVATPPPTPATPTNPPAGAGKKTLERDAADAVAAGAFDQAAQMYEQLAKEHPDNPAYAEAARILRARGGGK